MYLYQERRSRQLPATVWRGTAEARRTHRVLPDGCMDVIWSDGRLFVAGPDTTATLASWQPGTGHVGLRFDSGVGPCLLGVPADEVRDRRVALADCWGSGPASRLAERLADAADPAGVLEAAVLARPVRVALADEVVPLVLAGVRHRASVGEVSQAAGLSERQLRRRCQTVFGYGPKTLARVLRMQDALRLARSGAGLADVASEAGYADQPHLAREVRALAGVPLGELLA